MKAKLKVVEKPLKLQERQRIKQLAQSWWDRPYVAQDFPNNGYEVSRSEIISYLEAVATYRVTRVDFELKRALILKKLYAYSRVEDCEYDAKIDENGGLVVTEKCGGCNQIMSAK